jgi:hypothetical protein
MNDLQMILNRRYDDSHRMGMGGDIIIYENKHDDHIPIDKAPSYHKQLRSDRRPSPTSTILSRKLSKPSINKGAKYISPFVLKAEEIARTRSRDALAKLKQGKTNLVGESNDWNMDTRTSSLFDPQIKQREIFKIEPRKLSSKSAQEKRRSKIDDSLTITKSTTNLPASDSNVLLKNKVSQKCYPRRQFYITFLCFCTF